MRKDSYDTVSIGYFLSPESEVTQFFQIFNSEWASNLNNQDVSFTEYAILDMKGYLVAV